MLQSAMKTHPCSLLMAPITPRTSGQPSFSCSPLFWRMSKTQSSCLWRTSACVMLDSSWSGERSFAWSFFRNKIKQQSCLYKKVIFLVLILGDHGYHMEPHKNYYTLQSRITISQIPLGLTTIKIARVYCKPNHL